jgi:DNA-binding HxlR family transcriptional regulator
MEASAMDKAELHRRIDAGEFAENNGKILRTINILLGKNIKIKSLQFALSDINTGVLAESLFYLQDAGYIKARNIYSKIDADLTDSDEKDTEVRLTAKGIQLLKGYEYNPAVSI